MTDLTINREYYTEIDTAFRSLYILEMDIDPMDITPTSRLPDNVVVTKAMQRAFWLKITKTPIFLRQAAKWLSSSFAAMVIPPCTNICNSTPKKCEVKSMIR
jgi:hypothetical protein